MPIYAAYRANMRKHSARLRRLRQRLNTLPLRW
ncbi:MAG: hypothetical protein KGY39_01030 [Anaerolineales bacterium]|nr:hypothetical protein [Anaerolineales bacterium]MBS3752123.1 hypothetical protein [Anaerolineales bacterium]